MVGASLEEKEETMSLITRFELVKLSEPELRYLLRKTFNALAQSEPGSADRRNALASLENIEAELACRSTIP